MLRRVPPYYKEEAWDRFARFYDSVVKLALFPLGGEMALRKEFMDLAQPEAGERVLEVCCGTGALTALIAQRVGARGQVAAVDLSASMLRRACQKVKVSTVYFLRANAEHLPFPDNTFDRSFISFGLHEMPETARRNTLKEVNRTLKQDGGLFALDYNLPEGWLASLVIKGFVRLVEEEHAYRMLVGRSLVPGIEEAGFMVQRQRLTGSEMLRMVYAIKAPERTVPFP